MRIERRGGTLAMLLALGWASPAAADWIREYDSGERAVKAGDWAEAEARFRKAASEAAEPSARKRFQGQIWKPYVPQYYAGLAAYQQGACDRALDYWATAGLDAALSRLPDLRSEQQRGVSDCSRRLAQASPPPATTPTTTAAAAPTSSSATATAPATASTSPTGSSAAPSRPATSSAPPPAVSTPAVSRPSPPVAQSPAKPSTTGTATAPAALRNVVDQHLRGDYASVLRVDPAGLTDSRARAHAFLLRAAAHYTRAGMSPDGSQDLEAAGRDVRSARAALPSLNPDPALFSPKFRSFYQSTR